MSLVEFGLGAGGVILALFVLPGLIKAATELINNEVIEGLPQLSEVLLRAAANRYPNTHRARYAEEFQANLVRNFGRRRLSGLVYALFTYCVAPQRARSGGTSSEATDVISAVDLFSTV